MFIYQRVECPEPVEGQYYFYILECCDNSLYCGSSSILSGRIKEHEIGKAAMRREKQVKGWVRKKKENLIQGKWGK